jgi:DNA-binding MarR family transcriptional regulator
MAVGRGLRVRIKGADSCCFSVDTKMLSTYTWRYTVNCNIVTDPQLLILASLAAGQKHGYAMMEDIERFGGVRLGAGTLYGAITRLEEKGWIRRVESEARRKPYRITAGGVEHLEKQMAELDRIVKTTLGRLKHA